MERYLAKVLCFSSCIRHEWQQQFIHCMYVFCDEHAKHDDSVIVNNNLIVVSSVCIESYTGRTGRTYVLLFTVRQ